MKTMTKIQMDKWWNHANNDHKLIHLGGRNMDWLIFKLNDSTHCQIDFLPFSFFSTWKFSQSWSIYCCIPFPFLFLVFSTSVPFAHFCKIAVKSVGLFCLLYFFSSKFLLFFSLEAWLPPLSNSDEKKYSKPLALMSVRMVFVVRFLFSLFFLLLLFSSFRVSSMAIMVRFYQPRAFRPFFHYLFISVVVSVLFVFHIWFISFMQPKGSICWSL